jgi:hypothetical protein
MGGTLDPNGPMCQQELNMKNARDTENCFRKRNRSQASESLRACIHQFAVGSGAVSTLKMHH